MNRKKIALSLASVLATTSIGLYYFNPKADIKETVEEPKPIKARIVYLNRGDFDRENQNSPMKLNNQDNNKINVEENKQTQTQEFELKTYDIPLPKEFLQYIYDLCKQYNVPYETALAVMKTESQFKTDAYNKNGNGTYDVGLFQINSSNFKWLSKELQVYDFWEAYNNAKAGIYILSVALQDSVNETQALITYNSGRDNAVKLFSRGIYSNGYSDRVLANKNNLLENTSK